MPTITFGFECEFEQNAVEVTTNLFARNNDVDVDGPVIGSAELHRYHCECDYCRVIPEYNGGFVYPFRAQTDSSCSGEIISKVFESMDEAQPYMEILQDAAVEADGTPGYNSGFHVHVMIPRDNPDRSSGLTRSQRFFQYLRWESTLALISRGRFESMRSMNTTVCRALTYKFEDMASYLPDLPGLSRANLPKLIFEHYDTLTDENEKREWCRQIYRNHRQNDRHTFLNVATRWDTWEFRLFNSTRSAWRMELFCWLSLAFANNGFIDLLAATPTSEILDPNPERLAEILRFTGMGRAADLLAQQIEYQTGIDNGSIPFAFDLAVL